MITTESYDLKLNAVVEIEEAVAKLAEADRKSSANGLGCHAAIDRAVLGNATLLAANHGIANIMRSVLDDRLMNRLLVGTRLHSDTPGIGFFEDTTVRQERPVLVHVKSINVIRDDGKAAGVIVNLENYTEYAASTYGAKREVKTLQDFPVKDPITVDEIKPEDVKVGDIAIIRNIVHTVTSEPIDVNGKLCIHISHPNPQDLSMHELDTENCQYYRPNIAEFRKAIKVGAWSLQRALAVAYYTMTEWVDLSQVKMMRYKVDSGSLYKCLFDTLQPTTFVRVLMTLVKKYMPGFECVSAIDYGDTTFLHVKSPQGKSLFVNQYGIFDGKVIKLEKAKYTHTVEDLDGCVECSSLLKFKSWFAANHIKY